MNLNLEFNKMLKTLGIADTKSQTDIGEKMNKRNLIQIIMLSLRKLVILFLIVFSASLYLYAGEYASMNITNNSNDQGDLGNQNIWYKVTGFSEMITSGDWSFDSTNNELDGDADSAGKYMVKFTISFYGSAALWEIAIDYNGTKYGIIQRRISSGTSDIGNASGTCLIDVANSNSISLWVKAEDADPSSFTPVHSQIVIVEASQATTPYYAEMGISGNSTSQILSTSWSMINNYNDTNAHLDGWTFASNILTDATSASGNYLAIMSVSFSGATSANYEFGISKENDVPYGGSYDTDIVLKRTIGTGKENDLGNGNACGIINLSNGNTLRIKGKTSGSFNVTIPESNITLIKLDGTATAPYASMEISSINEASIALNQNSWIVESHLTDGLRDASYWEFDGTNDLLIPINLSAGYYLLNFYTSIAVPVAEANAAYDVQIAIFNNGSQIPNTTIVRQLQKKTGSIRDIGAASGTAIIAIDNPDASLDLRLYQDDLSAPSTVVTYTCINLFRIASINEGVLPITLSSFDAIYTSGKPKLLWTTQTETNNAYWNIYRSISQNLGQAILLNVNEIIEGAGTTTKPTNYTYIDLYSMEMDNFTYYYWLESIDNAGMTELYGPVPLFIPGDEIYQGTPFAPDSYGLHQNYPNPFNPSTSINFALQEAGKCKIEIYDIKGRKVITLFDEEVEANIEYNYVWNGDDEFGNLVSSGIYFYKLNTGEFSETKKMILMK